MLKESNFRKAAALLEVRRTLQYIANRNKAETKNWEVCFRMPSGEVQTNIRDAGAVEATLVSLRAHLHTVETELRDLGVELDLGG